MKESNVEKIKELIILLLGVINRPITMFHLQKELFILTNAKPQLKKLISFDKHYMGAYSIELKELVDDLSIDEYVERRDNKIMLNERGRDYYNEICKKYNNNEKFRDLLIKMKMIRELYDKLMREEFAILLYTKYEETVEASTLIDRLDYDEKHKIIEGLYKKGYITEKRYKELLASNILFAK